MLEAVRCKSWSFRQLKKALLSLTSCRYPDPVSVDISNIIRSGSPIIISLNMKKPDVYSTITNAFLYCLGCYKETVEYINNSTESVSMIE